MSIWNSQLLPPTLGSAQMFSTVNAIGSAYQRSSPTHQRSSPKLQKVPENDEVNLKERSQTNNQDTQRMSPGGLRSQDRPRQERSGIRLQLHNSLIRLFQQNQPGLSPVEMNEAQQCVRKILSSQTGHFLLDCYKQELTNGMIILREGIKLEEGLSLITKLDKVWDQFYTRILPTLQAIMYPLKVQGSQAIRSITLVHFRDIVVLKISLDAAIQSHKNCIPPGLKHMLLVLQSVNDSYPPNKFKTQLEKLTAQVIIPYLGYHGLYYGQKEPVILSSEPAIIERKKSAELAVLGRRISRPLSVQPRQLENLNDLYLNAIRKEQASNFIR